MTSADPGNVGYGTVRGRFTSAQIDGSDPDDDPDWLPLTDVTVEFTPSPAWLLNVTAAGGPATIIPKPVACSVDEDGYLIDWAPKAKDDTPPESVHQYVKLIATDDPQNNPRDWTWNARIRSSYFDRRFSFALPEGSEVDLAKLSPVAASKGDAIVRGPDGLSAYEVAVANGYTGSPAEWLASIGTFGLAAVPGHPGIVQVSGLQLLPEVSPGIFKLDLGG